MFSGTPVITDTGKTLLLRAASGETFTFTKFQVGNGFLSEDETPETMTQLKNVVISNVPITQAQHTEQNGYIQLDGRFDNYTDVNADFRWRELGLIAEDEDHNEYLYAYGYEDEYSDLVKAGGSDVVVEQQFSIIIAVGSTSNITAYVIPNMQYPTLEQFNEHVNNKSNPHEVTLEQLGGAKNIHSHSASDITSGVLPVSRGGTGVSSLDELSALLNMKFELGTFVGDGKTRQDINLGYKPKSVILFPLSTGKQKTIISEGARYVDRTSTYGPTVRVTSGFYFEEGKNIYHDGCPDSIYTADADALFERDHGGAAITATGFAVGYSSSNLTELNVRDVTYLYIAMRGDGSTGGSSGSSSGDSSGTSSGSGATPSIASISVSQSNSLTYNGRSQSPTFNVTYQGTKLVEGRDYEVTCEPQVDAGTYGATITGLAFTGSTQALWEIDRKTVTGTFTISPTALYDSESKKQDITINASITGGQLGAEEYHIITRSVGIASRGTETSYMDTNAARYIIKEAWASSPTAYFRVYAVSTNYETETTRINVNVQS